MSPKSLGLGYCWIQCAHFNKGKWAFGFILKDAQPTVGSKPIYFARSFSGPFFLSEDIPNVCLCVCNSKSNTFLTLSINTELVLTCDV